MRLVIGTIAGIVLAHLVLPYVPSYQGIVFAPGLVGFLGGYSADGGPQDPRPIGGCPHELRGGRADILGSDPAPRRDAAGGHDPAYRGDAAHRLVRWAWKNGAKGVRAVDHLVGHATGHVKDLFGTRRWARLSRTAGSGCDRPS